MSPKGNLATGEYTNKSIQMAVQNKDFVIGFISTRKLTDDPGFIHMTPGVQLAVGNDSFGQQYQTPDMAIGRGSDVIIVGRGITSAADPLAEAKKYREAGWRAYEKL